MEQVENRMVVDAEWVEVEMLQMRIPDRHSMRLQQIINEMEYGITEEKDEG